MKKNTNCEDTIELYDKTPIKVDENYGTILYFIRHGESIGNAKREFLGQMDKDLSEFGYVQAERTADFLADTKFDVIYSSDLKRAYNTAVPNAKRRGMEIIPCKGLREMDAGIWEGWHIEDIIAKYPHEFIDEWRGNFGLARLPGGESTQEGAERFYNAVYDIAKNNEGKRILIAAHAAVIKGFWGKISNIAPENLAAAFDYPTNASVSVVYFDGEKLIPGTYSHDTHLLNLKKNTENEA